MLLVAPGDLHYTLPHIQSPQATNLSCDVWWHRLHHAWRHGLSAPWVVGARGEALTRVTSPKEPRPVTYIPISSIHFGAACCYGRPRLLPSRPEFLNVSERVQRGTSSFGGWIPEGHMVEPSFCGNLGNPSVIAFPPQQDAFAQLSRGCVVRPALAGESRMYGIIGVSRSPGSARGRWAPANGVSATRAQTLSHFVCRISRRRRSLHRKCFMAASRLHA